MKLKHHYKMCGNVWSSYLSFSNTHSCSFWNGSVWLEQAESASGRVVLFNHYLYTMEQSALLTWVSCTYAHFHWLSYFLGSNHRIMQLTISPLTTSHMQEPSWIPTDIFVNSSSDLCLISSLVKTKLKIMFIPSILLSKVVDIIVRKDLYTNQHYTHMLRMSFETIL